jgi:hypothetical protein
VNKLGSDNPGARGRGRPKGAQNKVTKALKDMILAALDEAHPDGSVAYLKAQASANPTAFLTLVGKVLPMTIAGDPNSPLSFTVVTGVPRADS